MKSTWKNLPHVALDTETTGVLDDARIIEIAVVEFHGGEVGQTWHAQVWPENVDWESPTVRSALEVNRLTMADLIGKPKFHEVFPIVMKMLSGGPIWVGHKVSFDLRMLKQERQLIANSDHLVPRPQAVLDTMLLDFVLKKGFLKRKLDMVAARWGAHPGSHRALDDALCSGQILQKMLPKLPDDLDELVAIQTKAAADWEVICQRAAERDRAKLKG